MSSSSDDSASQPWQPLAEQPEWQDVQPIQQPESLSPVVSIQYSEQSREVLTYFRAIRAAKELSARALWLTQEVIYVNSADYTAWAYRWQCLEALGTFDAEMVFIEEMASRSPKNYQLWNHRRRFAFKRGPSHAQEELSYAAQCLTEDPKNYHAWAHRQAIVQKFELWHQELEVVAELLQEDVRNNSAWNQRFFILSEGPELQRQPDALGKEVRYVQQKILTCPYNESAWSFLSGLQSLWPSPKLPGLQKTLAEFCLEVLQGTPSCPPALAFLADMCIAAEPKERDCVVAQHQHLLEELLTADPLRSAYWQAQLQLVQTPANLRMQS